MPPKIFRKNLGAFRAELLRFSAKACLRGLCRPFTGLLSMRLPYKGGVLITPAGRPLGEIGPENLILMDLEENILDKPEGMIVPASAPYVINAYRKRSAIFAIGHFHPPYIAACDLTLGTIPLVSAHSRQALKEILRVTCKTCPSRFEGLCSCIEGQRKSYAGVKVLLLEGDGIVTLGKTLAEALMLADQAEHTARTAWLSDTLSPKPLSEPR